MKDPELGWPLLRQLCLLPLSWLSLSRGKRWLLVALSYGLGVSFSVGKYTCLLIGVFGG